MNDKLILRALRMLRKRADYWQKRGRKSTSAAVSMYSYTRAGAYESACEILRYAIVGDEEALKEYDYYDVN